ncbi:MAG: endolytic transglycosylase MltG, partial [Deltaproteobacteria bacterium]|nr:endolytic transglycosylase MltG [Deltaproteobacteria bacterium]
MKKGIDIVFILLMTFALLLIIHTYTFLFTPPDGKGAVKTVIIPKGASFRIIAKDLEAVGVITNAERFSLLARLKGVWKKVKAVEYELHTSMTPLEVLDKLLKGQVKEYTITIPEGYNIREIAETLERMEIVKASDFLIRVKDRTLTLSLGIDSDGMEGFLFPDTYRLTKDMTADEIIRKMVNRFNEVYKGFDERAKRLGMSMKEVVTLASIIEKEVGVSEERAIISAVFHNRLKKGMRL